MSTALPPLERTTPIVDAEGFPTMAFHVWWNAQQLTLALKASTSTLALATGSAGIGTVNLGTGAILRTVQDVLREHVHLMDYRNSSDPDETLAFTRAIAYLKTKNGGVLHLPMATVSISSNITVDANVYIRGKGKAASRIIYPAATGMFTFTQGGGWGLEDMNTLVSATGGGTAGAAIFANGAGGGYVKNIDFNFAYDCINLQNCQNTVIEAVTMWQFKRYGLGLLGGNISTYMSKFFINGGSGAANPNDLGAASVGIFMKDKCDGSYITDGDIILCHKTLDSDLSTGATHPPGYSNFTNVYFDSSRFGITLTWAKSVRFTGCWISTRLETGVSLAETDSITFVNTKFVWTGKHCLYVDSTAKRTTLSACNLDGGGTVGPAGTWHGVVLANNTTGGFTMLGCTAGNNATLPTGFNTGQMGYAVTVGSGCDNYDISHNDFRNNFFGAINGHVDSPTKTAIFNKGRLTTFAATEFTGAIKASAGIHSAGATLVRIENTGGANVPGASGRGLEIVGDAGTSVLLQAYNRTTNVYEPMSLTASELVHSINGTPKLTITPTVCNFSQAAAVPDHVYGTDWDGNLQVPTKNALYDKIAALEARIVALEPPPITYSVINNSTPVTMTVTAQADNWYLCEKISGQNGNYTDATVRSASSFAGDFTFVQQRTDAATNETLGGVATAPNGTYQALNYGLDLTASVISHELNYTATVNHGAYTVSDYLVLQRRGTTLSLYKTTNLSTLGTALRTWTVSGTYFAEAVFGSIGNKLRLRYSTP